MAQDVSSTTPAGVGERVGAEDRRLAEQRRPLPDWNRTPDPLEQRPRRAPAWFRSLAPLVLGVLLGAVAGFLVGAATTPTALAVTRVAVLPDPTLPAEAEQSTTDPDRFVQAQVLVLAGQDSVAQVTRDLRLPRDPEVTASQVGTTDVVEVDVRARDAAEAVRISEAVVDGYRRQRQSDLTTRVDASLAVVDRQLAQLDARGPNARTDQEYTRLLTVRNQLQLVRDSDQDAVRRVDQAHAVEQSRWSAAVRYALMGLVLGGLAGLLVKLLRDRRAQSGSGAPRA